MERAVRVKGRMISPTVVELDEPVSEVRGAVDVVLEVAPSVGGVDAIFERLRRLGAGDRSKDDIDEQIRGERA